MKKNTPTARTSNNTRKQASLPARSVTRETPTPDVVEAVEAFNATYAAVDAPELPQVNRREFQLVQFMQAHAMHVGTDIEFGGFALDAKYNRDAKWFGKLESIAHYNGTASMMFTRPTLSCYVLAATPQYSVLEFKDESARFGYTQVNVARYPSSDEFEQWAHEGIKARAWSRVTFILALETSQGYKPFQMNLDSFASASAIDCIVQLNAALAKEAQTLGVKALHSGAMEVVFAPGEVFTTGRNNTAVTPLIMSTVGLCNQAQWTLMTDLRLKAADFVKTLKASLGN